MIISKSGVKIIDHFKNTVNDTVDFASKPYVIILALVLFITGAGILINFDAYKFLATPEKTPDYTVQHDKPIVNVLGDENPELIINEYTDFECPYCSISNFMLQRLVTEVDGVMVVHRDYPISRECNPAVKGEGHKHSCMTALYARAAKKQGKSYGDLPCFL
jgi:protein-disulfide isomerase